MALMSEHSSALLGGSFKGEMGGCGVNCETVVEFIAQVRIMWEELLLWEVRPGKYAWSDEGAPTGEGSVRTGELLLGGRCFLLEATERTAGVDGCPRTVTQLTIQG